MYISVNTPLNSIHVLFIAGSTNSFRVRRALRGIEGKAKQQRLIDRD
jgi:hypothetical protein